MHMAFVPSAIWAYMPRGIIWIQVMDDIYEQNEREAEPLCPMNYANKVLTFKRGCPFWDTLM